MKFLRNIKKAINIIRKDGFNSLFESFKRHIVRLNEKKYSALTISHEQAIDWFKRREDEYNELFSAVYPFLTNNSIIFDIGANIGYFTYLLTQRLNFTGSAFFFEPIPNLAELCKVTFKNASFDVTVFDFGLSDEEKDEDIFISCDGNIGFNTIVSQKTNREATKVRIQLKTLDSCNLDVTPSLIKIDVEGAEYKVLRGMFGSLKKWHRLPIILCEVGWGQNHPAWDEEIKVFEEMERIGYNLYDIKGSKIEAKNISGTTDILFIPNDAI